MENVDNPQLELGGIRTVLTPDVINTLKYLYIQKENNAPLVIHPTMKKIENCFYNTHEIDQTICLDILKKECRGIWYLTATHTHHASQICTVRDCNFCPRPKFTTIDLSDHELENNGDGNLCLLEHKVNEPN